MHKFTMLQVIISKLLIVSAISTWGLSAQAAELFSKEEFPKTDFTKYTVSPSEIYSGGPPRDGIKPIDKPAFISIAQARKFLDPREPVVVLTIGKYAKAYPLRILLYHEIVNDEIDEQPVFVTHCPLCNTAIVFSRKVNNEVLDFGTTGRVRDSNLIMYDCQTESWWQQFTGDAIVGEFAGTSLQHLNSQIASFADYSTSYPNGLVLSQATGFRRYYGKTPYPGYDNVGGIPFLFKREIDFRLPPLERVLALKKNMVSTIYPFSYLENHPLINSTFADQKILVISQASMVSTMDKKVIKESNSMLTAAAYDRRVANQELSFKLVNNQIVDEETNSVWNIFGKALEGELKGTKLEKVDSDVHFAFAWLAFYPNTKIITE